MRVVLASSNPGKAREARAILGGSDLEVVTADLFIGDVETCVGYAENARLKATSARRFVGGAVVAEDSGLEVDALRGLPGPRSARFSDPGATAARNNEKLLRLLAGVPPERRTARYRAVALLLLPSGAEIVGEGVLEGRIGSEPRGSGGFGYDPLFVPERQTRTCAEMTDDEKNAVSHRGRALRALVDAARAAGVLD